MNQNPSCSGDCAGCGNCADCGGCASSLVLTQAEVDMLRRLGQIPFLPAARKASDMIPVFLEDSRETAQTYSLILQCLEKKALISMDYDKPLKGFDYSAYAAYPLRGSFALTQRGQQVLELLERQGITDGE